MLIRLHVWGPRACFVRPEFKFERISYDVMTPAAARAILASIYEQASIRWQIDRIHVLRPITFAPILHASQEAASINRLADRPGSSPSRRVALVLTDVAYLIEAHLTQTTQENSSLIEHYANFARRVNDQMWTRAPCLGLRNFPAEVGLILDGEDPPASQFPIDSGSVDLGWMFYDVERRTGRVDMFFRASIVEGVIDVPQWDSPDLAA